MRVFQVLQQSLRLSECRGYIMGDQAFLTDDDLFVYKTKVQRPRAFPVHVTSVQDFTHALKSSMPGSYTGRGVADYAVDPYDWMSEKGFVLGHHLEDAMIGSAFVVACVPDFVSLFHKSGLKNAVGLILESGDEVLFGSFSLNFMEMYV